MLAGALSSWKTHHVPKPTPPPTGATPPRPDGDSPPETPSRSWLLPTLLGVVAGAIGVSAYHKASTLQEEVHKPKAPLVEKTSDETLDATLRRLEARIALLEVRARAAPREGEAPSRAAPADPSAADTAAPNDDATPAPKEANKREERRQRLNGVIGAYWKEWGTKHGLSPAQIDGLTAMQLEAGKRKLDNQDKMTDGKISQPEARTDNAAAVEEVRRKAKALLTPEQFAQFEAEKGAEWGSSYRKLREMHAKAGAAQP